ncbi:phage regulatory CII family protein [Pseudomonas sp. MYb185]|uniref:phage regulatory CII family protein n=1 Tax=Pseudomonas sp. MYb185 TaxID=1848729 RepID=UPI0015AA739F|nr:phage regulatory CII family protein [Pseudomonas sp. MYb185]
MSRAPMSCTERAQREILPLRLALYHGTRDFPGGAAAIAAIYGRNPTTLQHKLSPTNTSHSLNPDEIEEITTATRDPRILDSMVEAYGDAAWVDLRKVAGAQTAELPLGTVLQSTGVTLRKQSALMDVIAQHLADDGRIDRHELLECKLHLRRAQGALLALERAMERDAEVCNG